MDYKEALTHKVFDTIGAVADEIGLETYVIGGFVRDYFLKRNTPKDIDIVAIGSGISLAKKVASQLKGKPEVTIFKNFGTAMIKHQGLELEFVGARKRKLSKG